MSADIVAQIIAMLLALIAASLAMKKIKVPQIPHTGPSISDATELYALNAQVGVNLLAEPNRKAAYFALSSALASGLMPLLTLLKWISSPS